MEDCYGIINAECRINVVVMLNVIKMSVIMQRVIVLSVVAPHIHSPMIELLDFFSLFKPVTGAMSRSHMWQHFRS
jgi:hypothetical protein